MREPKAESAQAEASDGFGGWLPIFACLVTQCGLSLAEAQAMKVGQAYALIAAHRRNQGWREAGMPYAQRDVVASADDVASASSPENPPAAGTATPQEDAPHE